VMAEDVEVVAVVEDACPERSRRVGLHCGEILAHAARPAPAYERLMRGQDTLRGVGA